MLSSTTNDGLRRRLSFLGVIFGIVTALVIWRLVSLQIYVDTAYFAEQALTEYRNQVTVTPPRGEIYDRNGVLLATNSVEYEIGLSPQLILNRQRTAEQLSEATGLAYEELLEDMSNPDVPWVSLVPRANAAMGQRVMALDLDGVVINPLTKRYYPHSLLASHLLGFVNESNEGYYGIEGYWNDVLQGQVGIAEQSRIPFDASRGEGWRNGSDLYLTIDSEVQYLAESTLDAALQSTGAQTGTIIVMHPRTGEVLAMASRPAYDPNQYRFTDPTLWIDPAISKQFEPGSTIKALTMAIALENGIVEAESTYEDRGVLNIGGIEVKNWDENAYGLTTMTELLGKSLNVGAATLSRDLGPIKFYAGMDAFRIGQVTNIDLDGEIPGSVPKPGFEGWFESSLATHSFGQGMAITPLQVVTAMSAIANDGLLMQPHMLTMSKDADGTITYYRPTVVGRAISPETAIILRQMMATALEQEASAALVPGYRIAGKTGTAQIPGPGGYEPDATIATFVGFAPVDDPQFIVFVKLDRPTSSEWGSQTAAPVFSEIVKRLVVLLEIPPDDVRRALGGG